MKREPEDFEVHQQKGFAAIEARKLAGERIIRWAKLLDGLAPGAQKLATYEEMMQAVRAYNAAEAALLASQDALDERARNR